MLSRGSAATDIVRSRYATDDPSQGIALWRLDGGRLKTYAVKETKGWRPRQVAFADECRAVVSGSDHGIVYVFDRRTGQTLDELSMGSDNWVQTVLVRLLFPFIESVDRTDMWCKQALDFQGYSSIVAARSGNTDDQNDIYIWTKQRMEPKVTDAGPGSRYLQKLIQVIMIAATAAFIIQNG